MARSSAGHTELGYGDDFGILLSRFSRAAIDPGDAAAVAQMIRSWHNRHGCQPSQGYCPDPAAHPADVRDMTPVLQALGLTPCGSGGRIDPYGKRRRD